jgi:hypothetical protein
MAPDRPWLAVAGTLDVVDLPFGALAHEVVTYGPIGRLPRQSSIGSAHAGALAALAFDDIVALFYQALALAILALLLLLDVGTFFVGHGVLPAKHFAESQ